LERTVRKPANDGIGDVPDARLEGQQGFRKAVGRNFGRKELNEMRCDEPRFGCFGCVLACVVRFGGFEDGYDAIWIDGDGCFTNTILRMDDELERGYYLINENVGMPDGDAHMVGDGVGRRTG